MGSVRLGNFKVKLGNAYADESAKAIYDEFIQ